MLTITAELHFNSKEILKEEAVSQVSQVNVQNESF